MPALCAGRPCLSGLRTLSLDLPGAPAAVIPADVDGDGRSDLVVVVAYNQWDEIAITESSTMDDIQGLVEVMTIVPAVIDRREVRVYRARPDGSYAAARAPWRCRSPCCRWRPGRRARRSWPSRTRG